MVLVNARYVLKPGHRQAFLDDIAAIGYVNSVKNEEGNLGIDFYATLDSDDDLFMIVRWEAEGNMLNHAKTAHVAKLQDIKAAHLDHMVPLKYNATEA
ncbi:MAG: antibiotic biosynthesis monooxygenase [Clostridiales Family XIII bacterium]|jgi:quinol monooxygenase YgiN|nr:antibiotic biosynthesis monooxygenase [Clostridiales Family XIII bacterium]